MSIQKPTNHLSVLRGPLLARGGMAEVYVAKQVYEHFEKLVTIKRILPQYGKDREFLRMLRDEAAIAGRLQHSNIAQVFGFGVVDHAYAMVMELINGCDLRSFLSQAEKQQYRMPIPASLYIAAEVAKGLHYAHQLRDVDGKSIGIVHRDISPQNILVTWLGEVKIIDFGIAEAQGKSSETRPGVVKGKFSYMSPEQVCGKSLDPRSDIFSLGIVLWEMLAMRRLFSSESEVDTMRKIQEGVIPYNLADLNHEVSQGLHSIVMKCLTREVDRRFASAGELSTVLRRYLQVNHPEWTLDDLGRMASKLMEKRRRSMETAIRKTWALDPSSYRAPPPPSLSVAPRSHAHNSASFKSQSKSNEPGTSQSMSVVSIQARSLSQIKPSQDHPSFRTAKPHPAMPRPWPTIGFPQRWTVALATVGMISVFLALIYKFPRQPQVDAYRLLLSTEPDFVQIYADGTPLYEGRYIRTPVHISLAAGSHVLSIDREGYRRMSVPTSGNQGDEIATSILELSPHSLDRFSKVSLSFASHVPKDAKVYFAEGLYYGSLPAVIHDVTGGREYILQVDAKSQGRFRCKISVPQISSRSSAPAAEVVIETTPIKRCLLKR